ncbi:MAG: mechanosensitive ion channel family protein [Gammaproteobacteria bacterium]|nr:mechanosensitive ion channel family protein [Gammaproteobacteria bacterium]
MNEIIKAFQGFHPDNVLRASLLLVVGYFIAKLLSLSVNRSLTKHVRPHQAMILRRILFFLIFMLFFASAIQQVGFRISALLGATGILTVAIGIAAQTSMSNLISGLFIIGEKPFEIGDSVTINDITGEVASIDFMSVRIRTLDNTMVRVPNETLVKSAITNLTWFPTRRLSIPISISYKENIESVMALLVNIAKNNPLCLQDPEPIVLLDGFGESSVNLQLQIWTKTEDKKDLSSKIRTEIKIAFDKANIEMPFPTRSIYTNVIDGGLPVRIVSPLSTENEGHVSK